jgi:SAM-dependent methyltransferase
MVGSGERQDVRNRAIKAYDATETIWPETDSWSVHTKEFITEALKNAIPETTNLVFNAGCGGNDYGLSAYANCVNMDISYRQAQSLSQAIVGDIERLPFPDGLFDVVLCVGAVVNYCEPYDAIPELVRVLKVGGILVVDFETTTTAEVLFSNHWGKRVSVVERLFADRLDKTYLFSTHHIKSILRTCNCSVVQTWRYHTATAIWRFMFPRSNLPPLVRSSDKLISRLPGLQALCSNVIFVCQRR